MLMVFVVLTMTGCFRNNQSAAKPTDETEPSAQSNKPETTGKIPNPTDSVALNEMEAYAELLNQYASALNEKWSGGTLIEGDMSLLLADCYGAAPLENIGYTLLDLDGDGIKEFIVAATAGITDEFYGKLVFDVYTLNASGSPVKALSSTERDRYFYAGENKFANLGSNGAGDAIETTFKLEGEKLVDMAYATAASDYIQLELLPMK